MTEQEKGESVGSLLSTSRLARNTMGNLISYILPLCVGLVTIPYLVHGMGPDRFGVMALAWMIVGYFGLFDLGLGRALTQVIAHRLGNKERNELAGLVWTGFGIIGIMSLFGAAVAWSLTPLLTQSIFKIPVEIQPEAEAAFYILAISIPAVTLNAGLIGILSAYQRFDLVNAVRIPVGIANFIAPAIVIPFTNDLIVIVGLLVATRLIATLAYVRMCFRLMPSLTRGPILVRSGVKPLFRLSSWLTITNIVGPVLVHADRFAIGAVISTAAVAYYAVPYEIVTKLWAFPLSIVAVLFPAFATSFAHDPRRAVDLLVRGMKYTLIALLPIVLGIVAFAREGLDLWLGPDFSRHSTTVLQCLALGVFINSLAFLPGNLIQGIGRPDLNAKLHILELPFYLIGLVWAVENFGIVGAAVVWTVRVAIDCALLLFLVGRLVPQAVTNLSTISLWIAAGFMSTVLMAVVPSLLIRGIAFFMIMATLLIVVWRYLLDSQERSFITSLMVSIK